MITESMLREQLHYDDSHLPVLSGPGLAHAARRRRLGRRVGAAAALTTVAVAAVGLSAWQRQPHIVRSEVAFASGPTTVLPDGRVDMRGIATWIETVEAVPPYDLFCVGDSAARTGLCRPVENAPFTDRGFTLMGSGGEDGRDTVITGIVDKPLTYAQFSLPDGTELPTVVVEFRKYPGKRVVTAVASPQQARLFDDVDDLTYSAH